jgi:hypothetical protein
MDRQQTRLQVLARIPCLSSSASSDNKVAQEKKCLGLLASSGRIIGQKISFKLLAGISLFLLVGAVLPAILPRKASLSSESTASCSSVKSSVAEPAVIQPVARRPVVMVSATSERLPPPVVLSPPPETSVKPSAELSTWSSWPSPNHSSIQQSEAGVKNSPVESDPTKVRSAEYQADVRAGRGQN